MGAIKSKIIDEPSTAIAKTSINDHSNNELAQEEEAIKTSFTFAKSPTYTSLNVISNRKTSNLIVNDDKNKLKLQDEISTIDSEIVSNNNYNLLSQSSVSKQAEQVANIESKSTEQQIIPNSDININKVASNMSIEDSENMNSDSVASFQPPDFLQKAQYFRSFRSASKRFFGSNIKKSNNNETIINNNNISDKKNNDINTDDLLANESETTTGLKNNDCNFNSNNSNVTNRNNFYRSFKPLNKNNTNNNLTTKIEIKEDSEDKMHLNSSPVAWLKTLRSKSHTDLNNSVNKPKNFLKNNTNSNSNDYNMPNGIKVTIREDIGKPVNKLSSKSANSIPNLKLSAVNIDPSEIENGNDIKQKINNLNQASNISSSSTTSSGFTRNPKKIRDIKGRVKSLHIEDKQNQFKQAAQVPIIIVIDDEPPQPDTNPYFDIELKVLTESHIKNDDLIQSLQLQIDTLYRQLEHIGREDPKTINDLSDNLENLARINENLQATVAEQKSSGTSSVTMPSNQTHAKVYEEYLLKFDKQNEILVYQKTQLQQIRQYLYNAASLLNQQSSPTPTSTQYVYPDSYYSSNSTDGYYSSSHTHTHTPSYANYPRNDYYYTTPNSYSQPSQYYQQPSSTGYADTSNAYYYAYRNQPSTNLYYDTVTGQYFYRKTPTTTNQYYYQQTNGANSYVNSNMYYRTNANANHFNQYKTQSQYSNANVNSGEEFVEKPKSSGVIITEVSDDDDDEIINEYSNKKKEYVDAISLNGDEQ